MSGTRFPSGERRGHSPSGKRRGRSPSGKRRGCSLSSERRTSDRETATGIGSPVNSDSTVDSGSAVAEFALISALLTLVLAGALQIGLVIHVRNTVIDSAIAGARQAGLADQTDADGRRLAAELITLSLGESYARSISVTTTARGAVEIVEVRVRTPLPVLGLWGPAEVWELRGRSIAEDVERD